MFRYLILLTLASLVYGMPVQIPFTANVMTNYDVQFNGTLMMGDTACGGQFAEATNTTVPMDFAACKMSWTYPDPWVEYAIDLYCKGNGLLMNLQVKYNCNGIYQETFTDVPGNYSDGIYFFSACDKVGYVFYNFLCVSLQAGPVDHDYCKC